MTDMSQAFADFMDGSKMQALFQHTLPDCKAGVWQITNCQIQHPRFKTYLNPKARDKSFLALAYHLSGVNVNDNSIDDRILYAKAYLGSRSLEEYQRALNSTHDADKTALLHLDEYGLVGWFFPHDPALPWLANMLKPEFIREYFSTLLLAQKDEPTPLVKDVAINIINYRPELRCTCRYDFKRLSNLWHSIYGKTFANQHGNQIFRRMVALNEQAGQMPHSFAIPKILAYDETLRTLWVYGMNGKPLLDVIKDGDIDHLMLKLAEALAAFHLGKLSGLPTLTETEMLAEITKKCSKLSAAFPAHSHRIEDVLALLVRQKEELSVVPDRLIHGDFHIQQLLYLDNNRIALFDYDELIFGNPLIDLANFSADLFNLELRDSLRGRIIQGLFGNYQKISDCELNESHFSWHLTVQLLTRAYRAYIQQKPNLSETVNRFLLAAEQGYQNN